MMTDSLYSHLIKVNGKHITSAYYDGKDDPSAHIFCSIKDHPVHITQKKSSQYQFSCNNYKVGVVDDGSGNLDPLTKVEKTVDERTVVFSYCTFLDKDKKKINKKGKIDGRLKVNYEIDYNNDDNELQDEEDTIDGNKRKRQTNTKIDYKAKTVFICVSCSIQECNQRFICGSCQTQHKDIGAYKFQRSHEVRGSNFMKENNLNLHTILHSDCIDFNYYKTL
jgi:hypothetical protein